jgi:deoxyribodipyrimidine photo-lyase
MVVSEVSERAINPPACRVRSMNQMEVRTDAQFVVYWMTSARRSSWNFGLDRAVEWANNLRQPLLVLEALRHDYPWANDRHHAFVLDGMLSNARAFKDSHASYGCFVADNDDSGSGLIEELAESASIIVTDVFPCFFLPRMLRSVAQRVKIKVEAVDSNGILPLSVSEREYTTAHSFRRFLQKTISEHLTHWPHPTPLTQLGFYGKTENGFSSRLLEDPIHCLESIRENLSSLPIDHTVAPGTLVGGTEQGLEHLKKFKSSLFHQYHENRNEVDEGGTSLMSSYLHYGHISSHQIVHSILSFEKWTPANIPLESKGSRKGWWNLSEGAEAFLDQLITWRELGFHFCHHRPDDYDQYESLPAWALKTLDEHRRDHRPITYNREELENAKTHDSVWNAAQRQLVETGLMHNYLRMLWGKKVLQWSKTPEGALQTLIHLNNKYALDGRDPNSYSGVFWVFGRFDRAWGPEREVFGKTRYMTSESTRRKLKLTNYLHRYGA